MMAYPYDMNDVYGLNSYSPMDFGGGGASGFNTSAFADLANPVVGGLNVLERGISGYFDRKAKQKQFEQQMAWERENAPLERQNRLSLANIQAAPAMGGLKIAQDKYGRGNTLLQQLLGQGDGFQRGQASGNGQGQAPFNLLSLLQQSEGPDAMAAARMGAAQPDLLSGMPTVNFQGMPQSLFQQQLSQIMGGASSALGGQLRSANEGVAGAGMEVGSPIASGIRSQLGSQANAGAQNALTGAYLNKYGQDFQRQQAQGQYNNQLGNLRLGQRQQAQQYGLGLGNLGLGQQQAANTRRQQGMGFLQSLLA